MKYFVLSIREWARKFFLNPSKDIVSAVFTAKFRKSVHDRRTDRTEGMRHIKEQPPAGGKHTELVI